MNTIAGVHAIETQIDLDRFRLQLMRARDLAAYVDREALLRAPPPPEPPYWMHLWPGALALARLIAADSEVRAGVRVVELGCGLALPALVAARRGADVVATDWKREPLLFARMSAARNGCRLSTVQMDWAAPALVQPCDLCLAADVTYDSGGSPRLGRTLASLLRRGGRAWLADSVSAHHEELARSLVACGFAVETSFVREEEERRTVWVRLIEARCGS
jgi:predicted nicotinamide N-methyase